MCVCVILIQFWLENESEKKNISKPQLWNG